MAEILTVAADKAESPLPLLRQMAEAGDRSGFARLAREIEWSQRRPEELTEALDLALSRDMSKLAMELAALGGRLFPDDERAQAAAHVLAPPVARVAKSTRTTDTRASMRWLTEHAREYRGQWIAVRDGKLLGAAPSLEELVAATEYDKETFIHYIP